MLLPTCTFEEDGLTAYFDQGTAVAHVVYPNHLTPEVTTRMYAWFTDLTLALGGIEQLKGCVFDFCGVRKFHPKNLRTAQNESKKINERFDLRYFPVAFVVENMHQEQMLRVSMRLTANSDRLRVIYGVDAAVQYILDWHSVPRSASG